MLKYKKTPSVMTETYEEDWWRDSALLLNKQIKGDGQDRYLGKQIDRYT